MRGRVPDLISHGTFSMAAHLFFIFFPMGYMLKRFSLKMSRMHALGYNSLIVAVVKKLDTTIFRFRFGYFGAILWKVYGTRSTSSVVRHQCIYDLPIHRHSRMYRPQSFVFPHSLSLFFFGSFASWMLLEGFHIHFIHAEQICVPIFRTSG